MQDAFDRGWWERVSDRAAPNLTGIPQTFDMTSGRSCDNFSDSTVDLTFSIRHRIGRCSADSSPRPVHSHGNSVYFVHYDKIAVIIHYVLDLHLSSCPWHISHFVVHIAHFIDCLRRRFCHTTDNTGGVDTPAFRTCTWKFVMERRGPLGPATQRREHEGIPSLGLVVPTADRGEAEGFLSRIRTLAT